VITITCSDACSTGFCSGEPDDPFRVIEETLPFPRGDLNVNFPNLTNESYGFVSYVVTSLKGLIAYTDRHAPGILTVTFSPLHTQVFRDSVKVMKEGIPESDGIADKMAEVLSEVGNLYLPELAMERLKGQLQSDYTVHLANAAIRSYEQQVVAMNGRTAVDEVKWRLGL
jgi:hypothetical protein